jgi:hypothetical protein
MAREELARAAGEATVDAYKAGAVFGDTHPVTDFAAGRAIRLAVEAQQAGASPADICRAAGLPTP